jgi:hypothetical protein
MDPVGVMTDSRVPIADPYHLVGLRLRDQPATHGTEASHQMRDHQWHVELVPPAGEGGLLVAERRNVPAEPVDRVPVPVHHQMTVALEAAGILDAQRVEILDRPHVAARDGGRPADGGGSFQYHRPGAGRGR